MILRHPRSTRTDTLLPYTSRFRSALLTKIRLMTDFRYLLIALAVSRLFFARRRLRTSRWHCALDDAAFLAIQETLRAAAVSVQTRATADRKSTRLNSSH